VTTVALASAWDNVDERLAYHGAPILKAARWSDEIGWYFFSGGLAGASAVLAGAARVTGQLDLARYARHWALAGLAPRPVLLIADLGRPARFINMLRVVKPTSPMSIGTWLLSAFGAIVVPAALLAQLGRFPRVALVADVTAGALGAGVATYTAVLTADTATPVWHESGNELPFLFAAGAAASAGAGVALTAPCAPVGRRGCWPRWPLPPSWSPPGSWSGGWVHSRVPATRARRGRSSGPARCCRSPA
jgi:formate-dependent nitrite reductase membrane component NrfD